MLSHVFFCPEEIISKIFRNYREKPQIVNYCIERLAIYYYKETIVKTNCKQIVGIHSGDFKAKRNMLTGLPKVR